MTKHLEKAHDKFFKLCDKLNDRGSPADLKHFYLTVISHAVEMLDTGTNDDNYYDGE